MCYPWILQGLRSIFRRDFFLLIKTILVFEERKEERFFFIFISCNFMYFFHSERNIQCNHKGRSKRLQIMLNSYILCLCYFYFLKTFLFLFLQLPYSVAYCFLTHQDLADKPISLWCICSKIYNCTRGLSVTSSSLLEKKRKRSVETRD